MNHILLNFKLKYPKIISIIQNKSFLDKPIFLFLLKIYLLLKKNKKLFLF
jgi:hypothetical protein